MYDVVIIGSGPAGLTAAIYTTRANLKTLIIAGSKWGGQLQLTTEVENFPGFPEGILGPDLMIAMRKQAERFGTEIVERDFKEADFSKKPFVVKTADGEYQAKAVIVATGADTMWLGVPGEQEFIGRGVSSCAPCDAAFFRNKRVIVVGGGDSAMEEALFLTKFATEVFLVHRRDSFRASQIMQDKVKANPKIHIIYNAVIEEILGDKKVEKVKLRIKPSDKSLLKKSKEELQKIVPPQMQATVLSVEEDSVLEEMVIDGIFVAIGHIPNSKVFKGVETDDKGYIKAYDHYCTNVDGVFVAGDVHDNKYRQAITASGYGCAAALETIWWLESNT